MNWIVVYNDLMHACCSKYDESLKYHRQALVLCPQTASTLSAMGYTYALIGSYSAAVDCFHKV